MSITITGFNGLTLGPTQNYDCVFPPQSLPTTSTVSTQDRPGREPLRQVLRGEPATFRVEFVLNAAGYNKEAFLSDIKRACDPEFGQRTFTGTHDFDGHAVTLDVDVIRVEQDPQSVGDVVFADCYAVCPYWQDAATSTSTGTSVVNGGESRIFPMLTITPVNQTSPAVKHRVITVTDNSGRGLADHLIKVSFDVAGIGASAAANYVVCFDERPVPFFWSLSGSTATVFFRVDVLPGEAVDADVYYSSLLANQTTAQHLNAQQLDTLNAGFANNLPIWNKYVLSTAPAVDLSWVPAKTGQDISGVSFGMTVESDAVVTFSLKPDNTLPNDADSMLMVLGAAAGTSNALVNLKRVLAVPAGGPQNDVQVLAHGDADAGLWQIQRGSGDNVKVTPSLDWNATDTAVQLAIADLFAAAPADVGVVRTNPAGGAYTWTITFQAALGNQTIDQLTAVNSTVTLTGNDVPFTWSRTTIGRPALVRAYVRYRTVGSTTWLDAWTASTPGTDPTALDIDGAISVVAGIEPLVAGAEGSFSLSSADAGPLQITLGGEAPTVSVGAAVAARYINGTIEASNGQRLLFREVLMDQTTLIVDCDAQDVQSGDGSRWYGQFLVSEPSLWLGLPPGTTTFGGTDALTAATLAWSYKRRWLT